MEFILKNKLAIFILADIISSAMTFHYFQTYLNGMYYLEISFLIASVLSFAVFKMDLEIAFTVTLFLFSPVLTANINNSYFLDKNIGPYEIIGAYRNVSYSFKKSNHHPGPFTLQLKNEGSVDNVVIENSEINKIRIGSKIRLKKGLLGFVSE